MDGAYRDWAEKDGFMYPDWDRHKGILSMTRMAVTSSSHFLYEGATPRQKVGYIPEDNGCGAYGLKV